MSIMHAIKFFNLFNFCVFLLFHLLLKPREGSQKWIQFYSRIPFYSIPTNLHANILRFCTPGLHDFIAQFFYTNQSYKIREAKKYQQVQQNKEITFLLTVSCVYPTVIRFSSFFEAFDQLKQPII